MSEELKPCPFCGGEARQDQFAVHSVYCGHCNITIPKEQWSKRALAKLPWLPTSQWPKTGDWIVTERDDRYPISFGCFIYQGQGFSHSTKRWFLLHRPEIEDDGFEEWFNKEGINFIAAGKTELHDAYKAGIAKVVLKAKA